MQTPYGKLGSLHTLLGNPVGNLAAAAHEI